MNECLTTPQHEKWKCSKISVYRYSMSFKNKLKNVLNVSLNKKLTVEKHISTEGRKCYLTMHSTHLVTVIW